MTAVEFFDKTPIENLINALTVVPDKIIYIGDERIMSKYLPLYHGFLEGRGITTELVPRNIRRNDIVSIFDVLCSIVEEEDECLFDLTGGDDLALVAMGMVYQKYQGVKNIQMQRLNVRNGEVCDCDNDGNIIYRGKPSLSVDESIRIHGGVIRYGEGNDKTGIWDMTDDFVADIEKMWEACKVEPGWWNKRVDTLSAMCEGHPEGKLDMAIDNTRVESVLKRMDVKRAPFLSFLKKLASLKLIENLKENEQSIQFTYKNLQIKKCLFKAGNVLEMKVLATAMSACDPEGNPYYNDALNGVYIDWDGEIHSLSDEEKDTRNEIDVILMRGITPVFISCKNGFVDDDELYKLDAVANRFGGMYVRKVLIATYLNKTPDSFKYFRQRAEDMGITLIYDVHNFPESKLRKRIKNLANP